MEAVARTMRAAAALALCGALAGGCVAVDVGAPQTFTKEYPAETGAAGPAEAVAHEPRESVSGRDADGRRILRIGLEGEVVTEQPMERSWERVSVVKQRKLAFGLTPARAELFYRPQGSLMPMVGWEHKGGGNYERWTSRDELIMEVYFGVLWLPYTLLVEPFLPYECGTHHWGRQSKPSLLPSGERGTKDEESKVKYLAKFSEEERREIGAWIWSDEKEHPQRSTASSCSHWGLFGFHKYCTYVVQGPERLSKRTREAPVSERRKRSVLGPYRVTLELPECGFARTLDVPRGETGVDFDLGWLDTADGRAEGSVVFAPPVDGLDAVRSPDDRALLAAAAGRPFPVRVQVRPAGRPRAAAAGAASQPQVIKEIHHYHETTVVEQRTPEAAPWDLETAEDYRDGRAEYLVTIRDASKKAFEVEREVRPEIERLMREAFLAAMPGMDPAKVRAHALPEFEGRTIRFKGVAFSVQPADDGWRYDPDTRRGTVRLRVSESMGPDEAKAWVRANIAAIVEESGHPTDAAATFRSLGESLEDGVLAVEFEAVE